MKKKIFIAGPMTGLPNFNRDLFNKVAGLYDEQGFAVMNPAILPDGFEHDDYIKITLAMLECCDIVVFLPEWEKSVGARTEYYRAEELGLELRVWIGDDNCNHDNNI